MSTFRLCIDESYARIDSLIAKLLPPPPPRPETCHVTRLENSIRTDSQLEPATIFIYLLRYFLKHRFNPRLSIQFALLVQTVAIQRS